MKKVLLLGAMVCAIGMMTACNTLFRHDVFDVVKHTYDNGIDTIDLGEALWFDWDTMYWFPLRYSLEEVNSIVNINGYWQDVGDRIVFAKGNKIVYYKEFFPYHETPLKCIYFDPDSIQVIHREDALFSIQKKSEKLYVLRRS